MLLGDFDLKESMNLFTYLAGQCNVRCLHREDVSVICHVDLLALQCEVQHRVEVNTVFIDIDDRVHLRANGRELHNKPAVAVINCIAMVSHLVRERVATVQRKEKRLLRCVVEVGRREMQEVFNPEDAQDRVEQISGQVHLRLVILQPRRSVREVSQVWRVKRVLLTLKSQIQRQRDILVLH